MDHGRIRAALVILVVLSMSFTAAAEDRLKPILDGTVLPIISFVWGLIAGLVGMVGDFFFSMFPSYEDSLNGSMHELDRIFPFVSGFHWIVEIILIIVFLALLKEVWDKSKNYIVNTIAGVLLILLLIHVFGVELKINLLTLVVTAFFGVPGVMLILVLHYMGF